MRRRSDLRSVLYGDRLCYQPHYTYGTDRIRNHAGTFNRYLPSVGASPEGVSYAIILSNLFVPMIERVTLPKAFGKEAKKA